MPGGRMAQTWPQTQERRSHVRHDGGLHEDELVQGLRTGGAYEARQGDLGATGRGQLLGLRTQSAAATSRLVRKESPGGRDRHMKGRDAPMATLCDTAGQFGLPRWPAI